MRRFSVLGPRPKSVDQAMLDKIAEFAYSPQDLGVPPPVEFGWSGGRHILDTAFTFERNVFEDALFFALRVDSNRIPAEIRRAYLTMEEEALAAGNPSGFISKKQKTQAKETLVQKLEDELRSGKHRRSKLVPVLWDLQTASIYSPAGPSVIPLLCEHFERTFNLTLQPTSPGSLAMSRLESHGKKRDYEDLRPTRFVTAPDGDNTYPEYPWTAKGPEPKDFLGNEFLMWLWHETISHDGEIKTSAGTVSIMFHKALDLDCAYGQSGRAILHSAGPCQMPEATDGLRTGKVPRKTGFLMDFQRQQYSMTFNTDTFFISALRLPDIEDAPNPRAIFEQRLTMLREVWQAMDGLYEAFLSLRASSHWESQTSSIHKWIVNAPKRTPASVQVAVA